MDSPVPLMYHDPDRSWITDPDPDHPKGTQVGHYFYNKPGRVKKSRLLLSLFLLATFRESTVVVCIASFMCFHSCVLLCINIIAKEKSFVQVSEIYCKIQSCPVSRPKSFTMRPSLSNYLLSSAINSPL